MSAPLFGLHMPMGAEAQAVAPNLGARLDRMAAAGWRTAQTGPLGLAFQGAGGHCQLGALTVAGMVFLDNRAELPPESGAGDPARSDLEVAAALRAAEGPEFVKCLSGSFAVLVHDGATGVLEGYRDHFGVYPFCYVVEAGAITCAADPRAALHLSGAALDPNPVRIADFLSSAPGDTDSTVFLALKRLPAGHQMRVQGGEVEISRYWQLAPQGAPIPAAQAAGVLRDRMAQAVARRLMGPAEVGAMLSGGLDSSSLAGLAAEAAQAKGHPPLQTLSFVYPGAPHDEQSYIDAANAVYDSTPRHFPIRQAPDIEVLAPLIEQQMELFSGMGLLKSHRLYHEARALGLKAVIDGHGGDEVISMGTRLPVELAARGRVLALYRTLKQMYDRQGPRVLAGLTLYHLGHFCGLAERGLARRVLLRLSRGLLAKQKINKGFKPVKGLVAPALRAQLDPGRHDADPLPTTKAERQNAEQFEQLRNLRSPRMQHGFEVLHWAAAGGGVEPRYPFFDRAVVEATILMPGDTKYRDSQSRWILKEAMRGILPEVIRTRNDKANFQAEIDETLRGFYGTRGEDVFDGLGAFVDLDEARAIRARFLDKTHDFFDLTSLGYLAVLIYWLRALDGWRARQAEGTLI